MRYDTVEVFNVDSKAKCGQLYLEQVARNKRYKIETKINRRQCPLSAVQVKIRESNRLYIGLPCFGLVRDVK